MARSANPPALLLALAGAILVLLGVAVIVAGLTLAQQLHALLPPVTIDAAAVGGATVALGTAAVLLGIVHAALAFALRRGLRPATVPSIVLCASMATLALAWAVAALVSAASASAPAAAMAVAAIGLGLVALAYAWAGAVLIGLRGEAGDAD